ncbi:MAG: NTP transferase domain-containing protein [Candidatus Thermoplasmatota archaeon]|jgi:GTP:adenosylcobinamide-phosphate guanylyltransferase|nr:NTP transferase domain-containing protein [Candidatus Thermoplasmatota archaeon]
MNMSPDPVFGTTVIMAGGLGTRMGNPEKALIRVDEMPLIQRIVNFGFSLAADLMVCCSGNTPETCSYCDLNSIKKHISSGNGYPKDLAECLDTVERYPVLVLPADVYIHNAEVLTEAILYALSMDNKVITFLQQGQYVGISIFRSPLGKGQESYSSIEIPVDFCVNINTPSDLKNPRIYRWIP